VGHHGLVLRAALAALAADGVIELAGDAPHLGNGSWLALDAHPRPPRAGDAPLGRAHPPNTVS
jgi:hypothetical protein